MRKLTFFAAVLSAILACGGTVASEPLVCAGLAQDTCAARTGCVSTEKQFVDQKQRTVFGCYPDCSQGKRDCGANEKCEALIWTPKGFDGPDLLVELSICRAPVP
jgi:hypothetical protein